MSLRTTIRLWWATRLSARAYNRGYCKPDCCISSLGEYLACAAQGGR